jgi:hypothetical protein
MICDKPYRYNIYGMSSFIPIPQKYMQGITLEENSYVLKLKAFTYPASF